MDEKQQILNALMHCLDYLNKNEKEILKLVIKDSFDITMINLANEYRKAMHAELYPN